MTVWRRCGDDAVSGLASPQRLNLARATNWPTAAQRTRPHPEARRQGRRHIVKSPAAIAATILRRAFHAQPVAARRTTRIQTLHGPTGQILHSFASQTHGSGGGRESDAAEAPRCKNATNWRDCAPASLVSQGKSIQLVVVLLQSCGKYVERTSDSTEKG
jgi:hypothetical protein